MKIEDSKIRKVTHVSFMVIWHFMPLVVGKPRKAAECNLEQSKAKGLMKLALRVTKNNSMLVVMKTARENYLKRDRR